MKLWLDDLRPAPDGWVWIKSVNTAKEFITSWIGTGVEWQHISLDSDLGVQYDDGGDGYKLVDWMVEHDIWPKNKPTVHSMNPVRAQTMREDIERYWHDPGS